MCLNFSISAFSGTISFEITQPFSFTFEIAEDSLLVDLQRFLVPTTTKLINAISQVEPMVLERTRSPVLMELARASLDFMLSTDPRTGKLICKYLIRSKHYYYFDTIPPVGFFFEIVISSFSGQVPLFQRKVLQNTARRRLF